MTLEIITDPALAPFRHGFFTRRGGASSGVFAGLNCGNGSSDQREIVRINRSRAAQAMEVPAEALVGANQVHSATAVIVAGAPDAPIRADALVTATPGLALAVLTADCQPVLMGDSRAGVVAAVHAGWRGALAGVLEAALDAMESVGAHREDVAAVIGPAISQRAYEVGPDLFDDILAEDREHARFFAQGNGDRLQFDLPGYGLARLRQAGVGSASWTGHCTYSDESRFYSFRRSVHRREADYGRMISAIRL